ncbi:MAG: hypothetical protein Q9188_005599 [Gyalolechia gomerana]
MPLIGDSTSITMPSLNTVTSPRILAQPPQPSKKRKRDTEAPEELEVDINAPEPPSKKALRKAKKGKLPTPAKSSTVSAPASNSIESEEVIIPASQNEESSAGRTTSSKRSEHGIWIGNLSFNITKADLQNFLTKDTTIAEPVITRVHMPGPSNTYSHQKFKPQNKGFAYVDFSAPEAVAKAVALSETLLSGRKVLIKDSHNFEGRPEKNNNDDPNEKGAGAAATGSRGPPTKRIFIGNLPFHTESADLEEHFSPCGDVVAVHVASFEDSGKCKGYAWVTFDDTGAAEAALRGWVVPRSEDIETDKDAGNGGNSGDVELKEKAKDQKRKPSKARKRWVNNFRGRLLRMESAEDPAVRYKKRFGRDAQKISKENRGTDPRPPDEGIIAETADSKLNAQAMPAQRLQRPPKKTDARTVKRGAALAVAPRSTGGIVASQGKKITFE